MMFLLNIFSPPPGDKLQLFRERFWKRYGKQISFPAIYAYNVLRILAKAVKQSDGKAEMLKEILSSGIHCDCLIGRTYIDQFGDAHHPWWIYKLENGSLMLVKEVKEEPTQ